MKKTSCIITLIGTETFEILESLTFPEKPERYNSEDLFKMLTSHFEPKRLKIAEQYRFWRNTQGPFRALLTTFPPYTKRLKLVNFSWRVSTRCFVHDSVTHELLFEKDLTLDKAISIVQNMEAAGKEANEITVPVPNPVNFVKTPSRRPTQKMLPPGPCPSMVRKTTGNLLVLIVTLFAHVASAVVTLQECVGTDRSNNRGKLSSSILLIVKLM